MNEKKCRAIVRERSNGVCEVCGAARATNFQHRKNRSQGGKYTPANGLDVCGSGTTGCHGRIHAQPALSHSSGHTVRSWEDPLTVPVVLWHGLVLLDDVGGYTPALELGGVS